MTIFSYEYFPMFIFLTVAACFNLPFFVRSLVDVLSPSRFRSLPAAPSALLATAFAELSWVLPCMVQCGLQSLRGNGPCSAPSARLGCDVMGYYSVFGSVAGMTSTVWVSLLTYRAVVGRAAYSAKVGVLVNVVIMLLTAVYSALPFMGVGAFTYSGEGFCYFDWYNPALSSTLLLIVIVCMAATLGLLGAALRRGGWRSKYDLYLMGLSLISAWCLWLPACIMGLAGVAFPPRFMITGAVLGHAQAIINPLVYGLRWRKSALTLGSAKDITKVCVTEDMAPQASSTPTQRDAFGGAAPSLPPSPPASDFGGRADEIAIPIRAESVS